jgi:hypothetical protein
MTMKRKTYVWFLLPLAVFPLLITRIHGQNGFSSYAVVVTKRVVLKSQTGAILPTTLFTSEHKGLFRVSAYAETTQVGTQGLVCGRLTWTDDAGEQSAPAWNGLPGGVLDCLNVNSTVSATGQTLILTTGHQPVTFGAQVNTTFEGSPEYEVVIIVEEMQPQSTE